MSQLEVDKIIPQSGTTLTIGDSGDTITFADGAVIGIDTDTLYIDSTNNRVGIGTSSPSATLEVNGGTDNEPIQVTSTDAGSYIAFADDSTTGSTRLGAVGNDFKVDVNSSERMRIDSSGNVGIGVVPETWTTNLSTRALQVGDVTSIFEVASEYSRFASNMYYDGTLKYITSNPATRYTQQGGIHSWEIAGSGTADSAITFTEVMRINISGDVGIGTSSPTAKLDVESSVNAISVLPGAGGYSAFEVRSRDNSNNKSFALVDRAGSDGAGAMGFYQYNASGNFVRQAFGIDSSGNVLVGKTSQNASIVGCELLNQGLGIFTRSSNAPLITNRTTSDGDVVLIRQDDNTEGTISVNGATVSYNGFTGTHWSRLSDNSKPKILKGTILESLDEMMDWYQVQFDITETDDEGNETTTTQKQSYALGDDENVGDVITYNYEGTDYQATIIQEGDVKHTKSKISDTVDAKNVYGVFVAWDNDDDTVNDMYVAQTGTFVVRINGNETVSKGDLIQSNGDGTGKVQADDLLRASTVAKVLSTTKIETYDDGSYIVPCSLHC